MRSKKPPEDAPLAPSRLIERPDGFYWRDRESEKLFGPFPTPEDAEQDLLSQESDLYHEAESLKEAENELGISDWIDPDTGLPATDTTPRLLDE